MPTNRRFRTKTRRARAEDWHAPFLSTGHYVPGHVLDGLQLTGDYLRGGQALEQLWRASQARGAGELAWVARLFDEPLAAGVRARHATLSALAPVPLVDRATAYAEDVIAKRTLAGPLVRLACDRHLRDLERGAEAGAHPDGIWFSPAAADHAFTFFEAVVKLPDSDREHEPGCPLSIDAEWDPDVDDELLECTCHRRQAEAGSEAQPFYLLPFQAFIVGSLFGWRRANGFRRFRYAFLEIGKGSGKTPLSAGVGLYGLTLDGERKAEICAAATTRDQAHILWDDAAGMVDASPELARVVQHAATGLTFGSSWFRIVSSEHRGLDGKRPHMGLMDEVQEHPTANVVNKIRAGAKRRRQPLFLETTNSGTDRTSVCWQHHEHARRVLEQIAADDRLFAYVCGLDKGDEPLADHGCWLKANPGLPLLPTGEYLHEQVQQANAIPAEMNTVLRLNFCQWTQATTRFLQPVQWDACNDFVPADELEGLPCYAGLDLGQTDDFSAFARVWMLDDGRVAVRMRFWLPESALRRFKDRPYDQWQRAGLLEVTDGNTTDYDVVEDAVLEDCLASGVRDLAYDKKFAEQMALGLRGAGIQAIDQPQGFALNQGIRTLSGLVASGRLCHGGNLILGWMADNVVTRVGRERDLRIDKERSKEKVDGIVALVMALQRATLQTDAGTSAYADGHGLMVV
jgi:phage terminase large subunit-like protein